MVEVYDPYRELRELGRVFNEWAESNSGLVQAALAEGATKVDKSVRELARSLPLVSVRYLIRRPYVICFALYGYQVTETDSEFMEGVGISKVCWPDRFNVGKGKVIALGRAKLDIAKKLYGETDVFVEED